MTLIPRAFWQAIAKQDKDTFVFCAVFAIVMIGLIALKAEPIYLVLTGALFLILYILMRIMLLKVQVAERKEKMLRSSARKARQIVDANATKSERQSLDKIRQSVKTRRN